MIDSIQAFSSDFNLSKGNKFVRQGEAVRIETGEVVSGSHLFCNEVRGIQFDIYPDSNRATFHCSLPKLLYGTSLYEVKPGDLPRAVSVLSDKFKEAGLKADPEEFTLSRVDFCANLPVDHHPSDYLGALSVFSMGRRDKRDIARENLSFRNSRREFTVYNKVLEVREKEKNNPKVFELVRDRAENILRVESRLRNTKSVYKELGRVHLPKLFDIQLSRSHLLREFDSLTHLEAEQLRLNFRENLKQLRAIYKVRPYRAFDRFLRLKGLNLFLAEFGHDYRLVQKFLGEVFPRATVYRLIREMHREQVYIQPEQQRRLVEEVREKLRKVA